MTVLAGRRPRAPASGPGHAQPYHVLRACLPAGRATRHPPGDTTGARSAAGQVPCLRVCCGAAQLLSGGPGTGRLARPALAVAALPDRGEPRLGGVELADDHVLDVGL